MRQGNNNNRQRSRGRSGRNKGQGQNSPNRAFDSNGPTGRLRGTAAQLAEKYTALARDARSNKDRVVVEGLLQHAEHYQRLVTEANETQAKQREQNEANRRQNNEQAAESGGAPRVNGADTPAEQAAGASTDQPDSAAAGSGDQPGVAESVPVQETPTPVRRQRRSTGQRRSRTAAKTEDKAEVPAAKPEAPAEPAPAPEPSE